MQLRDQEYCLRVAMNVQQENGRELVPCGIVTAVKVLGSSHAKVNLRITRIKQQNSTVSLHIFGQGKGGKLAVTSYQEEK